MAGSDATPDAPPPWDGPTVELRQRVQLGVDDALAEITAAVGCERIELLDLLVRQLGVDGVIEIARERRLRDGAARAAWQRARRD